MLCRPLGGLNDVLCQVEYARQIATKTRRRIVVQTETGSPTLKHRFGEQFVELFCFQDRGISADLSQIRSILSRRSNIYPERYRSLGDWINFSLEERTDGKEVQCRLEKNPPSKPDLVVHEGFGGGMASFRILAHLKISSRVLNPMFEISRSLPSSCAAIHFRNTDYQSSYERLKMAVERIDAVTSILIATDDDTILGRLKKDYPNRVFVSASAMVEQALPQSPVEAALQEMILLSSCSQLELIPLEFEGSKIPSYSGFGRLTQHIWTVQQIQKQGILFLASELIKLSLESPQRRRNPLRLIVFAAIRGAELFAHSYRPTGVYQQLLKSQ